MIAVAVFALPTGILGSGFEEILGRRREVRGDVEENHNEIVEVKLNSCSKDADNLVVDSVVGDKKTFRGSLYNILHNEKTPFCRHFDRFINILIFVGDDIFLSY